MGAKKKKGHFFLHTVIFVVMDFKNEYLIKPNCTAGNVPGSTKIYKSISFGVGQIKLQPLFCLQV